jgi:hypothetical protein
MAVEPAGTAVSGAPPEMPTIAAEILIVLEPCPVSGDTTEDGNGVVADRKREYGWIFRRRARRTQRPE